MSAKGLQPYRRGKTWWAKGRVEYNGRPITDYIRESTGSLDEAGARDWIAERENIERRRYIVGEERPLMFAEAVCLYPASAEMAKHLIPILAEFGDFAVKDISPKMVRDLGPTLTDRLAQDDTRRNFRTSPAPSCANMRKRRNDTGHPHA